MSWDGLIFCAPGVISVNEITDDFQEIPLGTTEEIGEVLRKLFPEQTHNHGQCCVEGDDFWLELNFGYPKDKDIRTCIGVRCNAGIGVIPVLQTVCDAFGARLFDNQTSDFAELEADTRSSMTEFSAWRDRALGKTIHPVDPE